jgi:hypothetical protein
MPSIVPSALARIVFLVLDEFGGRLGRGSAKMIPNYETLIRHLLEGQCNNPVRVVAFNTDEGWSRDASDDVVIRSGRRVLKWADSQGNPHETIRLESRPGPDQAG